ncbi:clotting factor C-like [Asterias amurensis]|uniref:clotting factor C-like n=1 Tax=Asterias amurensis TaxID=7602 RepID=UPI003AB621CE
MRISASAFLLFTDFLLSFVFRFGHGFFNPFCPDYRDFPNGFIKYKGLPQGTSTFYSQAQLVNGVQKLYKCHRGFILKGPATSKCSSGKWSTKKPKCIPSPCPRLQPTVNNYDSVLYSRDPKGDGNYHHGTVAQVYCITGTTLVKEGQGSTTCTAGSWLPSIPLCLTRETLTADADPMNSENICELPNLLSGMYLNDAVDPVSDGAQVEYECFSFAERATDIPVQCYQGEWYPDSPKCVEKSCEIPSTPHYVVISTELDGNKLAHGHHLQFECEKGYRLAEGDWEIRCVFGEWFGNIPRCELDSTHDFSSCGVAGDTSPIRGRVIGGIDSREAAWPWQAGIYWQRDDGSWFFFCGGTLVNQSWVLSAAHCFGYDEDISRLEVRLGITNRKTDHGTYREQKFNIDGLYIPKQHDFIYFDYDIALLHLSEPAVFNTFVRTVCLPDVPAPDDDVDRLIEVDEFAMVLGWGHSSPVPANSSRGNNFEDALQQLEMPLRTDSTCTNSLISIGEEPDQYTEHMFCAGYNRKQRDACFGDSGGPLMRRVVPPLPGETDWRWVQIGIVSSGKGCAVKGQFAFFTHVPKLMGWLDSVMKGNHTPSAHDMYLV